MEIQKLHRAKVAKQRAESWQLRIKVWWVKTKLAVKILRRNDTWKAIARYYIGRLIRKLGGKYEELEVLPSYMIRAGELWSRVNRIRNTPEQPPRQVYQYTPEELLALPRLNKAYTDATMEFQTFPPFEDLKDGSKGVDVATGQVVKWTPPPAVVKRGRKKKK